MKRRILGKTGLEVSELSLGAAFITGSEQGFNGALPIVKLAFESGMNLADTSADYGDSEKALGYALRELGAPCIVSTKLGPRAGKPFGPKDKACLRRIFEESLELLHRDVIDILMIHEPDRPGEFDWYNDGVSFKGPVVDLLQELKQEGLIKYTGLGGTTAYALARIMATGQYDVVLTAFNSSPLWREAMISILPEAKKQNMGVLLGSPTQQGWLSRRYDTEIERGALFLSPPRRAQFKALYELIDDCRIETPVFCLRWALGVPGVSSVLTGPRTLAQLEQNIQAVEQGPLPKDVNKRLDEIAAMVPFRPCDEPAENPFKKPGYWGPGPAK
ncbi:MAG TPA: aldo/keto reductase [Candidatus Hydrogenedentes bacterium]|nr:aldo/keto reductase [Candidatus Hydrogenedentota bacterium]